MTLNDLERRNSPYFAFFAEFDRFSGRLYDSGNFLQRVVKIITLRASL